MKFLFIDVECANCFKGTAKICSFGYVLTDEKFNIKESRDIIINPKSSWDKYVIRNILTYKKASYMAAPTFPQVYGKIKALMQEPETIVFCYGDNNDLRFINDDCTRYNLELIKCKSYDIQQFYKVYNEQQFVRGLFAVADSLGIDLSHLQEHNSCDDAMVTMLILKTMSQKTKMSPQQLLNWYDKNITTALPKKKKTVEIVNQ